MQSLPVKANHRVTGKYRGLAECMERSACPSSLSIQEDAVTLSSIAWPKATVPIAFAQFSSGRDFSNSFAV